MPGRWLYDVLYRFGAPWEGEARTELVGLVASGRLSADVLPRAIDLGCGSGANALFLADRGFEVVGVDFSAVALRKARARDPAGRVRWVRADLTASSIPEVGGPFDLLVDYGTLDDLAGERRRQMAATIHRLSRPGSTFLLWCFYARRSELPIVSFSGPSRLATPIEPGEEIALFGDGFDVERMPEPKEGSRAACFLMTRRWPTGSAQARCAEDAPGPAQTSPTPFPHGRPLDTRSSPTVHQRGTY